MSWDFFISFSTKDKERVQQIVSLMEQQGATCWFQLRDSKQDYDKAIIHGIRNCNALVLFLSPDSAKSTPVKNEVKFAQERANKKILPIILVGDILDDAYDEISMLVAMKNTLNVKDYKNDEELVAKIFDQLDFVATPKSNRAIESDKSITKINTQPKTKVHEENTLTVAEQLQIVKPKFKFAKKIIKEEFKGDKTLISIVIPDGVTEIGRSAFKDCTNLTSVVIPDSVTYVSWYAFDGCTALANITFPDGETFIGYQAFNETAWLKNQPDGVVYAGKVAYTYKGVMPKNTSITISDGTLSIATYAFYECKNLTQIVLPDSVLSICNGAFQDCTALSKIRLSDNLTLIDDSAFSNCTSLTSIVIPDTVENIFSSAFKDCTELMKVNLGNGLTEVGSHVFERCIELTDIILPQNITDIGEFAFQDCKKLSSIILSDKLNTIGFGAFYNCASLVNISIPQSVDYVGSYTFDSCDNLSCIYCEAMQNEVENLWAFDWHENCNAEVIWGCNGNTENKA